MIIWLKILYFLFNVVNDRFIFVSNLRVSEIMKAFCHTIILIIWGRLKFKVVSDDLFKSCVFVMSSLISHLLKFVNDVDVIILVFFRVLKVFINRYEQIRLDYRLLFLFHYVLIRRLIKHVIWRSQSLKESVSCCLWIFIYAFIVMNWISSSLSLIWVLILRS